MTMTVIYMIDWHGRDKVSRWKLEIICFLRLRPFHCKITNWFYHLKPEAKFEASHYFQYIFLIKYLQLIMWLWLTYCVSWQTWPWRGCPRSRCVSSGICRAGPGRTRPPPWSGGSSSRPWSPPPPGCGTWTGTWPPTSLSSTQHNIGNLIGLGRSNTFGLPLPLKLVFCRFICHKKP